jgi:hypothetical protein
LPGSHHEQDDRRPEPEDDPEHERRSPEEPGRLLALVIDRQEPRDRAIEAEAQQTADQGHERQRIGERAVIGDRQVADDRHLGDEVQPH